ncbi:MAG: flagellar biosynthetic protein FliO [Candidatus Margulisiibacteriota bacterium]
MTGEALVLQSSPIITTGYVMQVLISLAVVIGLIYVLARYFLPRLKVGSPGRIIQVVDRVMLEPQVSAYILKVGKKAWLVVAGNKGVKKIDEVSGELPT